MRRACSRRSASENESSGKRDGTGLAIEHALAGLVGLQDLALVFRGPRLPLESLDPCLTNLRLLETAGMTTLEEAP